MRKMNEKIYNLIFQRNYEKMFEKVSFYETQEKINMIMVVKMRKHIVKSHDTSFNEIFKK